MAGISQVGMRSSVEHTLGNWGDPGSDWIQALSLACVKWSESLACDTHLIFVGWMRKVKHQFLGWKMKIIIPPSPPPMIMYRVDPIECLYP